MTASLDLDLFSVALDTDGFRSQLSEIGARNFVRRLVFEGCYVTSIVRLHCEPYERDTAAVAYDRAQQRADAA